MNFFLKKNFGLRLNIVQALQFAHEQSELGLEQTTPNPCVGSVILNEKDELVGLGYHKKYGHDHAEVEAFQTLPTELQTKSEELTVFVTLEPCAHQGQTPSCAKMLAAKKVKSVIYLLKDPNPLVSGQGQKILEASGVKTYCVEDLLRKPKFDHPNEVLQSIYKNRWMLKRLIKKQKNLNRHFLFGINSELPFITLKWAQTLNGAVGLLDSRLLITNQEVQKQVHHLRACHDLILVGSNTVMQDDPKLNNRFGSSKQKINKIGVLDPNLEVLTKKSELEIFKFHEPQNMVFITKSSSDTSKYEAEGFNFIKVAFNPVDLSRLDLVEAFKLIKKKFKINSILIEGGRKTLTALLEQNLFNEIYIFNALKLNFAKNSIRLPYKLWVPLIIKNIFSLKVRIYEDNFLINIQKF